MIIVIYIDHNSGVDDLKRHIAILMEIMMMGAILLTGCSKKSNPTIPVNNNSNSINATPPTFNQSWAISNTVLSLGYWNHYLYVGEYTGSASPVAVFDCHNVLSHPISIFSWTAANFINETGIDPQGLIYIADLGDSMCNQFDVYGYPINALNLPGTGVGVAPNENIYVINGNFLSEYTDQGVQNSQSVSISFTGNLVAVSPVAPYPVYVAGTNQIEELTSGGVSMTEWGDPATVSGKGQSEFFNINGITVGSTGIVYVTDGSNSSGADELVQEFSANGTFLTQWGGPSQFTNIQGIAVTPSGNVFVGDNPSTGSGEIQKFTP